jgi:hypothetical protein
VSLVLFREGGIEQREQEVSETSRFLPRSAVEIVIVISRHIAGQPFRRSRHFEQRLADRLPLFFREIVQLRLHQAQFLWL